MKKSIAIGGLATVLAGCATVPQDTCHPEGTREHTPDMLANFLVLAKDVRVAESHSHGGFVAVFDVREQDGSLKQQQISLTCTALEHLETLDPAAENQHGMATMIHLSQDYACGSAVETSKNMQQYRANYTSLKSQVSAAQEACPAHMANDR